MASFLSVTLYMGWDEKIPPLYLQYYLLKHIYKTIMRLSYDHLIPCKISLGGGSGHGLITSLVTILRSAGPYCQYGPAISSGYYSVSTQYLHSIYTVSTKYLHNKSSGSPTGCDSHCGQWLGAASWEFLINLKLERVTAESRTVADTIVVCFQI